MKIYQVDAFAKKAFEGNPAAVCIMDKPIEDNLMQRIAMEMNLSETAFAVKRDNRFHLRWFTPESEVALCGHATLATAHILWSEGIVKPDDVIYFDTKSGELTAKSDDGFIELDFPAKSEDSATPPKGLIEALSVSPLYVGRNAYDYLVVIKNATELLELKPDMTALKSINVRGIIVTAQGDGDSPYDFVSRFFAPAVGVDEDPVTGSAHCCLAPYWANVLKKNRLIGYQASRRGGEVIVEVDNDRVKLIGTAVTTLKGLLLGI